LGINRYFGEFHQIYFTLQTPIRAGFAFSSNEVLPKNTWIKCGQHFLAP
jgi:hypothetical protein